MAGPKKPKLSQMERGQKTRGSKGKGPEKASEARRERSYGGVVLPSINAVATFVESQRYVTPYVLAERFGLKLGIAKRLLRQLEREDIVGLVAGDNRVGIFTPSATASTPQLSDEESAPKDLKKKRRSSRK